MMHHSAKTWVEISKTALKHNISTLRRHIGQKTALMAVVKSNAYGHGLEEVAKIAEKSEVDWFSVDNVDEGIRLRKAGIQKPILVLGYTLRERLNDCLHFRLSFVVYNMETVHALKKLHLKNKEAFVHIKIETGTSRQGVEGKALQTVVRELKKTPGVVIQGVSTHFANIEDTTDRAYAIEQLERFKDGLNILLQEGIDPPYKHTASSAAALLFPSTHFNMVRVGISLYGLWPSVETMKTLKVQHKKIQLREVLSWKTLVAQVKEVKKGTPISYGLTERVKRDSRIAVLPIGYWDGYDRGLSRIAHVLIRGKRCKILGRICMNMCVVDVTDVPRVCVEDEVILIGKQGKNSVSAFEIAKQAETIHYEITTRINPLIPREVV